MDGLIFSQEPQTNYVVDELGEQVKAKFESFIQEFCAENDENSEPYYIRAIRDLREKEKTTLYVDCNHVISFDAELAMAIDTHYYRLDPFLRKATQNTVKKYFPNFVSDDRGDKEFFVSFFHHSASYGIRALKTSSIGKLCSIRGTVTRTSEVRPELLLGTFICMDCRVAAEHVEQQFKYTEPLACKNPACQNTSRWQLNLENSKFVDWQKVRVQENSDEIPSGSMPRSMDIILRNEQVEKAKAGDSCIFTGTLIVVPDMSRGRLPGPKIEGRKLAKPTMHENKETMAISASDYTYKLCFLACSVQSSNGKFEMKDVDEEDEDILEEFTREEIEQIKTMSDDPKIYTKFVHSIAPTVFGHHEVKKGILLMLFGGVHKITQDRINLRGDINVCIVGDPSTSKSQFLKYVVSFLPRAVYTSGKASSAAGLTATVVRDPDTGDFNIEAGALMLADNGVCCVDEFDKMDPKDQVAIHEAMEQQTISISKAGIHATLNARTSILAAANPIGGRYDKSKSLKTNLNITPAIMSRFDLFFVVLDECNEESDHNIARHIVNLHQNKDAALEPEFSTHQLQRYIRFAKTLKPTINPQASKLLVEHYRKLRQSDMTGNYKTAYRITVRQLESLIRLSEALARVHCDQEVKPEYVEEAARLLRKSIIHVENSDIAFDAPPKTLRDEITPEETPKMAPVAESKMVISYQKYQQLVGMIEHHLKQINEPHKQADIIDWCIRQMEEEIESQEQLDYEARLVKNVLNRMVKDQVLVVVQESATANVGERFLQLHPDREGS